MLLIRLDEAGYRAASFLDDRILKANTEGIWAPLALVTEAAMAPETPRPLRFIFTSAMSRLDAVEPPARPAGHVLSLREAAATAASSPIRPTPASSTPSRICGLSRIFASTRTVVVRAT